MLPKGLLYYNTDTAKHWYNRISLLASIAELWLLKFPSWGLRVRSPSPAPVLIGTPGFGKTPDFYLYPYFTLAGKNITKKLKFSPKLLLSLTAWILPSSFLPLYYDSIGQVLCLFCCAPANPGDSPGFLLPGE